MNGYILYQTKMYASGLFKKFPIELSIYITEYTDDYRIRGCKQLSSIVPEYNEYQSLNNLPCYTNKVTSLCLFAKQYRREICNKFIENFLDETLYFREQYQLANGLPEYRYSLENIIDIYMIRISKYIKNNPKYRSFELILLDSYDHNKIYNYFRKILHSKVF